MEACEDCGFVWADVGRDEVGPRTVAACDAIAALLTAQPEQSLRRPSLGRWSAVEYGAHVRDVLLIIRDRLVVGLVEDTPDFKPLYRDERISLGLYDAETAAGVASELAASSSMFLRVFDGIAPDALGRPVKFGYPAPARRTLLWMGQQVVHEVEHHRGDIEENLRILSDIG